MTDLPKEAEPITINPIGVIRTCFPEKFGIPRQPLLAPAATGCIELLPPYNDPDTVIGLDCVSHIWLSFIFHQHTNKTWKPMVRPPRLGGNNKLGVLATRSSFRPNYLGLSVVALDRVDTSEGKVRLWVSGVDLLDGTPIVDIKPYVPYADNIPHAVNNFANAAPTFIDVILSDEAKQFCTAYHNDKVSDLAILIRQVLQQDPRPAYQKNSATEQSNGRREYGVTIADCNVRWYVAEQDNDPSNKKNVIIVTHIHFL